MPRKTRKEKPLIYIFCEGESEQAYAKFLQYEFHDAAAIKIPAKTGLFETAENKFRKDARYRDNAEVTDEIWFFFDVEQADSEKWGKRSKIIKLLRGLRRKPNIRVRLLMTTACIEYWLMLHYEKIRPSLVTPEDKKQMLEQVKQKVPLYKKGDYDSTSQIVKNYKAAIANGQWTLNSLQGEIPCMEDTEARNLWLCRCGKTFTTVQEAIVFLKNLSSK
jgi:hypothetical protein